MIILTQDLCACLTSIYVWICVFVCMHAYVICVCFRTQLSKPYNNIDSEYDYMFKSDKVMYYNFCRLFK